MKQKESVFNAYLLLQKYKLQILLLETSDNWSAHTIFFRRDIFALEKKKTQFTESIPYVNKQLNTLHI